MANKLKHHGTNTTLVSTSEMYSRIISNIGDINFLIDLKGKILKINLPNKNINRNLNSWLNKNIFDFLTIESKEKLDLQITSLTEINILSTLVKDGTENDGKLEELHKQLEELQNRKPKTTVIVKEVAVDKKGRKL